ncbi:MAG: hypothetical protein GF317_24790 [Candidatus Lokiarchaeota archaeon]|nr:hypothetical protein [Candidatus Lokiarchaeota archaeon]MBD3202579.1 hypothetical protein [Candidatus Lokiarchaeota archaeon]
METKEEIKNPSVLQDQNLIEKNNIESEPKSAVSFVHAFESEVVKAPKIIEDEENQVEKLTENSFFQKIRNYFQNKRQEEVKKIKLQMDAEKNLPKSYRTGECKKSVIRNLPQDYSFRYFRF